MIEYPDNLSLSSRGLPTKGVQTEEVEPGMFVVTDKRYLHWSVGGWGPFPSRREHKRWERERRWEWLYSLLQWTVCVLIAGSTVAYIIMAVRLK